MKTGLWYQRALRRVVFALATGGFVFGVGSGCDPTVRSTVLGGFQDLATTFVDAVFLILAQDEDATGGTTTPTT